MLASPISIPSSENAPASAPAKATVLPFDAQPFSTFTNVFQGLLKGSSNSSKSGVAGKSQDSGREPAGNSGAGNNSSGVFRQSLDAVTPVVADSFSVAPIFSGPPNSSFAEAGLSETGAEDGNAQGLLNVSGGPLASSSNPGLLEDANRSGMHSTLGLESPDGLTLRKNGEGWGIQILNPATEITRATDAATSIVLGGSALNTFSAGASLQDQNAGADNLREAASFFGPSSEDAPGRLSLSGSNSASNPATPDRSSVSGLPGLRFAPTRSEASANHTNPGARFQSVPADASTAIQSSSPSGSNSTGSNAAEAASAGFSLQNLQTLIPSGWAPRISGNFQSRPSADRTEPPVPQPVPGLSPSMTKDFASSVALPGDAGAPQGEFKVQFRTQLVNTSTTAGESANSDMHGTPTSSNPEGVTRMLTNAGSEAATNPGDANPWIQSAAQDLRNNFPVAQARQPQGTARAPVSAIGFGNNLPAPASQPIAPGAASPEPPVLIPLHFSTLGANPRITRENATINGTSSVVNPFSHDSSAGLEVSEWQPAAIAQGIDPASDPLPAAYRPYVSVNNAQNGVSSTESAVVEESASTQHLASRLTDDGQAGLVAAGKAAESDPIFQPLAPEASLNNSQSQFAVPELSATIDSVPAGYIPHVAVISGQPGTAESKPAPMADLISQENSLPAAVQFGQDGAKASGGISTQESVRSESSRFVALNEDQAVSFGRISAPASVALPPTTADSGARDVGLGFGTSILQSNSPAQKLGPMKDPISAAKLPAAGADALESGLTSPGPTQSRIPVFADFAMRASNDDAQPAAPSSSASNTLRDVSGAVTEDPLATTAVANATFLSGADPAALSSLPKPGISAPQDHPDPPAAQFNVPAPTTQPSATNFLKSIAQQPAIPFALVQGPNSASAQSSAAATQNDALPSSLASSQQWPENPPSAPSSNSQPAPSGIAGTVNAKAAQTALSDMSFLSLLAPSLTRSSATTAQMSVPVLPSSAMDQTSQLKSQPTIGAAQSISDADVHSAVKSAAIGGSTIKLSANPQPQPLNSSLSAPSSALPEKSQSQAQGNSNGSSSNDSNTKPDHASADQATHTDGKTFVQTLDVSAANPAPVHSPAPDAVPAAATAVATPVPAAPTNSAPQAPAPAPAASRSSEFLPDASQNQAVVSSAHMIQQPGQTEIRIEMQADSLGGVELRAHIAGDQIGASISVEHHDVQMALTSDLAALHSALSEKNLRVETLTVSQGTSSSFSGGSTGQDAGQRSSPQNPTRFAYLEQHEESQTTVELPAEWSSSINPRSGLSVVA